MLKSTYDYIVTICYVWFIIIGFFIAITLEVMILIGLAFPILIIIILNRERKIDLNNSSSQNIKNK
ncbi:MAG: hypothetical protein AB7P13_03705 [Candidatus Nitrosocosmicus sp.]|jgi:hypothetical protein|uniref:hypothetical protein n=1 Tax=Candidatus Nitrosocosmicus sp. FF01 TaxID=3397670 RepID=UPI0039ED08E9